jgi:MFS family permease
MSDGFAAFRHPGVTRLTVGRFMSELGTTATSVAVGWQLYEMTSSKWALAWVGLVEVVPVVLLSLPAGIASDRFPRRQVAIATHLLMALSALGLMAVTHFKLDPVLFYPALFFTGVGAAFHGPAVRSLLPQLVPPSEFANANAWVSSASELAAITGPALAGFFIALSTNAQVAFGFAVFSHLFFAGMLLGLPHIPAALTGKSNGVKDLLAGFNFVINTRVFLAAITLDLFAVLLGGAVSLLPVYAKDVLHVGPTGLGWLRAAPSLGALSMALIQTRLKPWKRPGVVLLWTVAGFGLSTVVFGLSELMWLSMLALFFTGVFDNVSVVIRSTLEQSLTPDSMRGRVSAINGVFIGLSNEFGAFESASVAAIFTPLLSVVGGGVGTLLVALSVFFVFPQLRTLPPLNELKPVQDD